jgi:hypothetical protein
MLYVMFELNDRIFVWREQEFKEVEYKGAVWLKESTDKAELWELSRKLIVVDAVLDEEYQQAVQWERTHEDKAAEFYNS